ncbi:MAG: DUF3047 domain-containing protein [Balneolales bacterium]|nr:DUF3047 domain-containing protein [Balneolales bacterium]
MNKFIIHTFFWLFLLNGTGFAQDEIRISVADFNPDTIENTENPAWSEQKLPRRDATSYSLMETDSSFVLKAISENSASGLVYRVNIDPAKYPIIEWSWKVGGIVEDGDFSKKDGDDYPARIYITFNYSKKNLKLGERIKYETLRTFSRFPIPLRAINYVWANKAAPGTIAPNAYTNWVYMIAVDSGEENVGIWKVRTQNIYEDYKTAFGEEPPIISGVAIMTDTDNTGNSARAYYGDIIFKTGE